MCERELLGALHLHQHAGAEQAPFAFNAAYQDVPRDLRQTSLIDRPRERREQEIFDLFDGRTCSAHSECSPDLLKCFLGFEALITPLSLSVLIPVT